MRFAKLFVSVAFGVLAAACETAPPPTSTPEEGGSAVGTRGMVSTAHPIATEAGLNILRKGGNAFDAAVVIASTLNVVPSSSTIPQEIRDLLAERGVRNLGNAHGLTIEYGEDGKPERFTGGTDPRGTGLARGY